MEKLGSIKHKVFVLKDEKSETYGYPVVSQSTGVFLRDLSDRARDGQSMFSKHPMDFSIFEIGEYDPDKGTLIPRESKICHGLVQDLLGPKQ